jgi:TonB-linked SusC/RagA family outer membrane protein
MLYPSTPVSSVLRCGALALSLGVVGLAGPASGQWLTKSAARPPASLTESTATTVPLTNVLAQLKETHDVFFLYDYEKLRDKSLTLGKTPLRDVERTLGRVLPPLGLTYRKLDARNYAILAASPDEPALPRPSRRRAEERPLTQDVMMLASRLDLLSVVQDRRITGRVTSAEDKAGIPGVSVRVKDSNVGVITNEQGNFILNVPDGASTIVVSSIGYIAQEITITGQATFNIELAVDQRQLDEVVFVGYGTQKRKDLTGSVASVKGTDLKNLPATDLTTALQGRVPGAFITTNSGAPGSGSRIYIRGPVSINGGDPLYVVDGVPFVGTGYSFNMQDIESVEILKDASAAAIYGAKAAAGVILVTTKRGKAGQMRVSLNANYGVRNVMNLPQTLRRDEYIRAKQAFGFAVTDLYGPQNAWSQLPDTDWFGEVYRPAPEQNYTIGLAGGSERSTFYISGNFNRIDGTRIGNWLERYTLRINSDHQLSKRLRFSQTLYGKYGSADPNRNTNQGELSFRNTPVMRVYDPTNPIGGWGRAPRGFQGGHDVQAAIGNFERDKDYEINLAGTLDYELLQGLRLRGTLGTSIYSIDRYFYDYKADVGTSVNREDFSKSYSKSHAYIGTFTLNYDRTFGRHTVKGLLGYEARRQEFSNLGYSNFNPLVPVPANSDLVQSVLNANGTFSQGDVYERLLSQFARAEYSFADKYLLTVNVRRDGYGSKFGPNNKFGIFPGVSAGWVLSEEGFIKTLPAVSFLKLRAGYGVLGNAVGRDFAFSTVYEGAYSYDFTTGGATNKQNSIGLRSILPNPDIQWESVATANIGIDGALWQNQLSFNLDYYDRQTRKMLYNVPLAPSAGSGADVPANIGQMSNRGIELNLEYRNKIGEFNYNVGVNGGFNRNRLISLNPDLGRQIISRGSLNEFYGGQSVTRSEPGLPLGQFYGLQVDGIYATDASSGEVRPKVGDYTPKAGDLIYRDVSGPNGTPDGRITDDDRVYIGNPWPKFTYGINLGGRWRGFDLTAFFQGVSGNQLYNAYESFEHMFFSDYTTTAKIFETSFFNGNGLTDKPRVGTIQDVDLTGNGNWSRVSSYHVQPGGYLRLRNLQVGYTIPSSVLSRVRMSSVRIFLMTDNLFTLTRYKGINPEVPQQGNDILRQGLDVATSRYPMSRLFSLGLNAEF